MAVERKDLENKLRQIESIVDETKEQAQVKGTAVAVIIVVTIILVFLLGRRRGQKAGGARVEVYRLR